ncbi:diacylglycerol/lipid kinase family protein [Nonomuraea mangrovi]|uniref:Diacylglycerol/lipid kinase family protein n=1 Tax=Nonomuraea mangrovi TaxID=2316207 RepID=A0ABW4SXB7_9ACTN
MKLLVIRNSKAGGADDDIRRAAVAALEAGADVRICEDPEDLGRVLGEHSDRVPVVMGGDGTLHALVAALADRGELESRPVGLVPMGTGNDLARAAGLPLDPPRAARVVLDGRVRPMDLLADDRGGIVINAVHLGVGALGSREAVPLKSLLRRAAYVVGAVIAGVRAPGWRLRVVADGGTLADGRRRVLLVGIGNGRSIGGGTPLTPDALLDDGLADVVVSFATGPLARLAFALRLRRGEHPDHADVRTCRAREITIAGEPVPVNADGEVGPEVTRRTWTVRHAAWRLLVPAPGRSDDSATSRP